MARPRFKIKLNKTLVTRLSAVAVLVGMGSIAILQGQLKKNSKDDKPVAAADGADVDGADVDGADVDGADADGADVEAKSKKGPSGKKSSKPPAKETKDSKTNPLSQNALSSSGPPPTTPPSQLNALLGGNPKKKPKSGQSSAKPATTPPVLTTGGGSFGNSFPPSGQSTGSGFQPSKPSSQSGLSTSLGDSNKTTTGQPPAALGGSFKQLPKTTPSKTALALSSGALAPNATSLVPSNSAKSGGGFAAVPNSGIGSSGALTPTTEPLQKLGANTEAPTTSAPSTQVGLPRFQPSTNQLGSVNGESIPSSTGFTPHQPPSTSGLSSNQTLGASNATTLQNRELPHRSVLPNENTNNALASQMVPSSVNSSALPRPNGTAGQNATHQLGSYHNSGVSTYDSTGTHQANSALALATMAVPGAQRLEGVQAPSLVIQKSAPLEVQVDKPAIFTTIVRNAGTADANHVVVTDRVPKGTRLTNVNPATTNQAGDLLTWELGTLKPGQQVELELELTPTDKGEIGSVAQVSFHAQASVRTACTQAKLGLTHVAPKQVLIGDTATVNLTIRNDGDGAATGVVIDFDVPNQLSHPAGRVLEYRIGTLGPGEIRELPLIMTAKQAGQINKLVTIRAEGNLSAQKQLDLEVIAPKLKVTMRGPTRRFIERRATHHLTLENLGTASATNVGLVASLPPGIQFVEANNQGKYDPQSHAVYWSLPELPAGKNGEVELVTLPVETGDQTIQYEALADLNLRDANEMAVQVSEIAQLKFEIADTADPIEVGSDTTYHVLVTNVGSKASENIEVAIEFPPAMQPTTAVGPTKFTINQSTVLFERIASLAPGNELKFEVRAQGQAAGEPHVRALLQGNDYRQPLVKEEQTNVYSDR